MGEFVTFIAAILVASVFIAIFILGKNYERAVQERNAWMQGLMHLKEHPEDFTGAMNLIMRQARGSHGVMKATISFMERLKRE